MAKTANDERNGLFQTYTFDLQRPPPASRLNEPNGTFELVNLDDLGEWVTWPNHVSLPVLTRPCVTLQISWPMVSLWPWVTFHHPRLPMAPLHTQRKSCPTARPAQHTATSSPVSPHTEKMSHNAFLHFAQWSCRSSLWTAPQEEPDADSKDASSTSNLSVSAGEDPVDEASNSISVLMDSPDEEQQNEASNPGETIKRSRLMSITVARSLSSAHLSFSASFSCSRLCQRPFYWDKPGGCGAEWTEPDPSRESFICAPLLRPFGLESPFRDQQPRRARMIAILTVWATNRDSVSWRSKKARTPQKWPPKKNKSTHLGQLRPTKY